MKILVIGGSYFLGRVFTMLAAADNDVTVLNRGTYSMEEFGAGNITADRHDPEALRVLEKEAFDVVVDFCAYCQGDIEGMVKNLPLSVKQYVFISTVDVYRKWTHRILDENAPLEERRFGGENGEYIWQKILLERELKEVCRQRGIAYTIVRPAILYGPFNYAMRESVYVQMACQNQEILCPVGAAGRFQPVYVKDAAAMVLALCKNAAAMNEAYNLAGDAVDYESFLDAFAEASKGALHMKKVSVYDENLEKNKLFIPFPFTEEETEVYDGRKILRDTGLFWTPLSEGLEKTWRIFRGLYGGAGERS